MEKTIKVTFTEQAHAVVATTQVEYSGDNIPSKEDVLSEAQDLFEKATQYSARKTMQKR